jgi:hypothetical protein
MKKTIKYTAKLLAKVRFGETLWKVVKLPTLTFENKNALLSVVSETMYLANDIGICSKGIVLEIIKETRIEDEDEVFINKEYEFESVGNLTDAEYFEMQDELLNKTK